MDYFNINAEPEQRRSLRHGPESAGKTVIITDATVSCRIGFRGKNAAAWLASQGLGLPESPNQACCVDGIWVLRLSQNEFWLIDPTSQKQDFFSQLDQQSQQLDDIYRLYCQHSHLLMLLSGQPLSRMLAKVCGVDLSLSAFAQGSIAQTQVARLNAIVVRLTSTPADEQFMLLADISSSQYLWEAMLDAASEFND